MRQIIIAILLLTTTVGYSQIREPKDNWHKEMLNDPFLCECMLNIGLFPKGFYWMDVHKHIWLVVPNPLTEIGRRSEGIDRNFALCISVYLSDPRAKEVLYLVEKKILKVYPASEGVSHMPAATHSDPPVFLQIDKHD